MVKKISYGGWENCHQLANRSIELVVTADVGPRVIRLGVPGGQNLFKEFKDMMGLTGGDEWRIYGGHRLWHSPEAKPRTYHPDNTPAAVTATKDGLKVVQETESTTGIQKQIEITLHRDKPYARVAHRLTNRNLWAVTLAPWALSVMAPGGTAVMPQAPYGSHEENLLPSRPLVLWPYTNMADKRWGWGERYIQLKQDPKAEKPTKLGIALAEGWAAYALKKQVFIKRYKHQPGAQYPDFGCSFEAFTNSEMLEVETLGPVTTIDPGKSVQHVEHWFLFDNVDIGRSESSLDEALLPLLAKSEKMMSK